MRAIVLWLIPLWVVAFVVQKLVVLVLRSRRPRAAAAIETWWAWAPLIALVPVFVVVIGILIWNAPLLGIAAAVIAVLLTYGIFFTDSSIGSPFRPRRR